MFINSPLYKAFLAEREEILKHKWLESEKVGYDIGFEKALLQWVIHHRAKWRKYYFKIDELTHMNSIF